MIDHMTPQKVPAKHNVKTAYRLHNFDPLIAKLSIYAANRVAAGLPGIPSHPKRSGTVGWAEVSKDTGIPETDLKHEELRAHVEELADQYRIANPAQHTDRTSAQRILTAYAVTPPPRLRSGQIDKYMVGLVNQISDRILKGPLVRQALDLVDQLHAGSASPTEEDAAVIARLEAYAANLVAAGKAVPWNRTYDKLDLLVIAAAVDTPRERLRGEALAPSLKRIFADLPKDQESLADEIARVKAAVDAAIAGTMKLRTDKYHFAQALQIPPRHVDTIAELQAELVRWQAHRGTKA